MEHVIDKARALADAILASDCFKALRAAEDRVLRDDAARELTERYEQAVLGLRQKEGRLEPISPEEKKAIRDLRAEVEAHPQLRELTGAQRAYGEMMEAVNGTIHRSLSAGFEAEEGPEEPSGPSRIILP